jgi:putative ABC transport system ATP-binding protein
MLKLENLRKEYKTSSSDVKALDDISLHVEPGEFLVVRGPSGAGKTTLLLASGALLAPDAGTVHVDGADPYSLSPNGRAALRAEKIGFVFQQFHLIPYLTVLDNLLAPGLAAPQSPPKGELLQRAEAWLDRLQMTGRKHHTPQQLSVGEKQRTAVARAMINAPKLLLADEPTGNLDPENSDIVLGALSEFANAGGAVLVVTHHEHADSFATRKVLLRDGKIAEEG